jgi:hypothetical protein
VFVSGHRKIRISQAGVEVESEKQNIQSFSGSRFLRIPNVGNSFFAKEKECKADKKEDEATGRPRRKRRQGYGDIAAGVGIVFRIHATLLFAVDGQVCLQGNM